MSDFISTQPNWADVINADLAPDGLVEAIRERRTSFSPSPSQPDVQRADQSAITTLGGILDAPEWF